MDKKRFTANITIVLTDGDSTVVDSIEQRKDESDENFLNRTAIVLEFMRARHGTGK